MIGLIRLGAVRTFYTHNQQWIDAFASVFVTMKIEKHSRFWQPKKVGMWHIELASVSKVQTEWSKGRSSDQPANLFKHSLIIEPSSYKLK